MPQGVILCFVKTHTAALRRILGIRCPKGRLRLVSFKRCLQQPGIQEQFGEEPKGHRAPEEKEHLVPAKARTAA